MTRSSRRMDTIAGRSKWSSTDKKCEECKGKMVKLRANVYVCIKYGLEPHLKNDKYIFNKYVRSKRPIMDGHSCCTSTDNI